MSKAALMPPHCPPATHLAGTGDSKDSPHAAASRHWSTTCSIALAVRLTPPCLWCGHCSSPLPTPRSQAHSPGADTLPWSYPPRTVQHHVRSQPATTALALSLQAQFRSDVSPQCAVLPCPEGSSLSSLHILWLQSTRAITAPALGYPAAPDSASFST